MTTAVNLTTIESMIIQRTAPADMAKVISEHLQKKAARAETPLFVFSSDVAAQSWSEWAVTHPAESGVQAVALEDFTAWDTFKGVYLAGNVADKACIPALLRKLFVRNLIHENLSEKFITKILPGDDAETAYAFTDWLSKIVPSLKLWHEKYTMFLAEEGLSEADDTDEENKDFNAVYTRYCDFLSKNHFFEPSWLTPEFIEQKKTIVIFYPELLEDFSDYEEIFVGADNVIAVELPNEKENRPLAYKYPDSRSELRRTLLHLRALHENGVKWTDMAVSVPDLETYRAYIKRECARYCVPVNIRSGEPLTKNCAGLIFRQMYECYTDHFSYTSVRALLQNEYVPWKEDVRDLKESLISEGNRMRTICGYEEQTACNGNAPTRRIDAWEEALGGVAGDALELKFYRRLKRTITAICETKSFAAVQTAWMTFRQTFLSEDFSDEANKILGRCVSDLNDIIDIEKRYVDALGLTVEHPFAFFLNELDGKTYRPQEILDGVSVFPYKLSAAAAISYQFVIDASQANLDIPYKKLGFLSTEKRLRLLGADIDEHTDASQTFVRLYAKNAKNNDVLFSYAEDSFSGFAIAHNALTVANEDAPRAELDDNDFFVTERKRATNAYKPREVSASERRVPKITETQQNGFLAWAERTDGFENALPYTASNRLRKKIIERTETHRKSDALVVTQSDLAKMYPCPRKWVLSSILNLREETLDTDLMQTFDMGNINHKVLELFMQSVAQSGATLPVTNEDGVFDDEAEISEKIRAFTVSAIHDRAMDFRDSPLVIRALESQSNAITQVVIDFLHVLCHAPEKPETPKYGTAIKGFGGYTVRGAEIALAATNADGIKLFGKIDCLLSDTESGDFVIIDYKNTAGAMPKQTALNEDENGLLGDFQMPMYVTLVQDDMQGASAAQNHQSDIRIEAAYFYAIKDKKRTAAIDEYKGVSQKALDAGEKNTAKYEVFCADTVRLFDRYVSDFAARVRECRFEPIVPKQKKDAFVHVEPYAVCVGCEFKGICRTTFTVGQRVLRSE